MEKSGIDYLFFTSQPASTVAAGNGFTYQVTTKSKKGGVKYKLESGPDGMQVSPQGKAEWKVPPDFAPGEVNVIISVSDSTGQEVLQTFTLRVEAARPKD